MDKNLEELAYELQKQIHAPVIRCRISTLGPPPGAIFVTVSLDERHEWDYGILHNSRYFQLCWDLRTTSLIECSRGNIEKRFRKVKVQNVNNVIDKINLHIGRIK